MEKSKIKNIIFNLKGFTLTEILITIGIILILSAIGIVSYHGALDNSDLKFCIPIIIRDLNGCLEKAKTTGATIVADFNIGTSILKIKTYYSNGTFEQYENNYSGTGLLKRKFIFRKYLWQNGDTSPTTFTFIHNGKIKAGKVYFGSAFADAEIWADGDRIVSNK